jgi:hypothetical protein
MATRMQQRRGTAAQWTAANPILAAGEIGFETDTSKFKMGNGSSAWSALTYFANAAELAAIIDSAPGALNTLNELAAAIGDDANFFTTVAQNLTTHVNDSTMIHGIVDTAQLALLSNVESAASGAASALAAHEADLTNVHGIANTALLATTANVDAAITAASSALGTHAGLTTTVHGIADTSVLVTQSQLADAVSDATVDQADLAGVGIDWNPTSLAFDIDSTIATKIYADAAVTAHDSDTSNVHGIVDTAALATKTYADGAVSTAVAALTKSSVGLGNVDNTTDANKPVSTATQTALDLKAPLADPTFTGTVSGVTKSHVGLANVDNTADSAKPVSTAQATAIATAKSEAIASATASVDALLTGAPAALNTLDELAAALGDDANFASTVTTNLGLKAPLASPTFTGTVTVAAAGVAFTDGTQTKEGTPSRTPIIQKSAAYTLSALTERDSLIEVSAAGAITIPADSTLNFPIGTSIDVLQTGTGAVSVAAGAGVTLNATPGLTLRTQWSTATLMKRAANTWVLYGDLK